MELPLFQRKPDLHQSMLENHTGCLWDGNAMNRLPPRFHLTSSIPCPTSNPCSNGKPCLECFDTTVACGFVFKPQPYINMRDHNSLSSVCHSTCFTSTNTTIICSKCHMDVSHHCLLRQWTARELLVDARREPNCMWKGKVEEIATRMLE